MGLLSNNALILHTNLLGSGWQSLSVVESLMLSGLNNVVNSDDLTIERDLLINYNINYETVNVNNTCNLLRKATEALERHITSNSGQTFNDYLNVKTLKVSQNFANLSSGLGVIINSSNIGN